MSYVIRGDILILDLKRVFISVFPSVASINTSSTKSALMLSYACSG